MKYSNKILFYYDIFHYNICKKNQWSTPGHIVNIVKTPLHFFFFLALFVLRNRRRTRKAVERVWWLCSRCSPDSTHRASFMSPSNERMLVRAAEGGISTAVCVAFPRNVRDTQSPNDSRGCPLTLWLSSAMEL